jgi:hypothetical protein
MPGAARAPKAGSVIIYIAIILAVVSLLVVVKYQDPIRNFFQPPKDKFVTQKPVTVDVHPPKLQPGKLDMGSIKILEQPPVFYTEPFENKYPTINGIRLRTFDSSGFTVFGIGNTALPFYNPDLERGIEFSIGNQSGCPDHKISLFLKNMRLYVAAEFKDFEKEEVMGVMEYNHWKVYKDNIGDFKNDDFGLEVKDKQGKVAFSICSGYGNVVYIAGYFINHRSVMVVQNNYQKTREHFRCIPKKDSDWRRRAEYEVGIIKSIFEADKPY